MINVTELAGEIVSGRRLTNADDLGFFFDADLDGLCAGADMIRSKLCGDHVDLCSIVNGKSGKCPENCRFCAQSAHNHTGISEYGFMDEEEILRECRHNDSKGVHRFAIVTAGRSLEGEDFRKALSAFRRMGSECGIKLCASLGLLTDEQFRELYDSGVRRYHCNIETSRRNFPNICTTHSFEDKLACIKRAKNCGFQVCSGGIIGMGETWQDRLDMALTLAELQVDSVPINALMPIKGTPLAENPQLTEADILRTIAMFRYVCPTAHIRLAAGRALMENSGERAFRSGANAAITGDMLTTSGSSISSDMELLRRMGFDIERED